MLSVANKQFMQSAFMLNVMALLRGVYISDQVQHIVCVIGNSNENILKNINKYTNIRVEIALAIGEACV
jgi:hypothetical protein